MCPPIRDINVTDLDTDFSSTMSPQTSLFNSTRPKVRLPRPKMRLSFLTLPGEIRNRVYQYYFQDSYCCELVAQGCDFSTVAPMVIKLLSNTSASKPRRKIKQCNFNTEKPLTLRFPRLHGPDSPKRKGKIRPSEWLNTHGGLVLVNRQIHLETISLLYHQLTFVFEAPRRLTSFLHTVAKVNHGHITKLHLYYTTYGSPAAARDVVWQEKHIDSWTRACKLASKSFNSLQQLELHIRLSETAPKFNLRQKWLQPLWQFRRLTCDQPQEDTSNDKSSDRKPHPLTSVGVYVRTRLWGHHFEGNVRLAQACNHLHHLYGQGISKAILGAKEEEAMSGFEKVWNDKYRIWQHHLGFASTGCNDFDNRGNF